MTEQISKSNEILAQDISYIKRDILEIKTKLDTKYVSHETFDLTITSINQAITSTTQANTEAIKFISKVGLFIITPIYVAVIGLLFKLFVN